MAEKPENDEDGLEFQDVTDEAQDDGEGPALESQPSEDIEVVLAEGADEPVVEEEPEEEPAEQEAAAVEAEAVEDPEPDDDELSEDDKKNLTRSMQKRILREKRLGRRQVEQVKQEAQQAVSTERQERLNYERDALESKKTANEMLIINLDFLIKDKQGQLKKAKEDGDTDKEVEISSEIADLYSRKREQEGVKQQLTQRATEFEERAKQPVQVHQELSPTTKSWLERNKWMTHAAFKSEAIHTRQLDVELSKRMDPSDPRYFQELDRLIAREIPLLKPKIQALSKRPAARTDTKQQGAVAPKGRSAPGKSGVNRASSSRVTLTREDLEMMAQFKLDPKNPEHQKQWAREKLGK